MVGSMGMSMQAIVLAAALAASSAGWHYETTHDPLGQAVHVAGVVLQVNLGQMQFGSVTAAPASGLSFNVGEAPAYLAAASMAPITDGVGTYEIKGSEAGNIAHLLMQGESVTVHQGAAGFTFPL